MVQGEGASVGSRIGGGGAVEERGSLMAGSRKLCAHISAGRFMKVLFFGSGESWWCCCYYHCCYPLLLLLPPQLFFCCCMLLMLSVSGWGCSETGGAPVKKKGGRKYTRYPPLLPPNRLSSHGLPPPADHKASGSPSLLNPLNYLTSLSSDASFHPFLHPMYHLGRL